MRDENGEAKYLQRLSDGFIRYRNILPEVAATLVQDFVITISGITAGAAQLRYFPGGDATLELPNEPRLHLREQGSGRYLSSTGELLDLTQTPPTYANIRLHPETASRAPRQTAT